MLGSKFRRKIKDIQAKLSTHSLRQKVLQPVKTTAQKTLLFTSVFVMSMGSLSVLPLNTIVHAAGAYQLTGKVVDQNGNGVANVSITATPPGTDSIQFGPVTTVADGTYTLGIDSGTYDIHFEPAGTSGFSPVIVTSYAINSSQSLNINLVNTPSIRTLSGKLTDQNGAPLRNVGINIYPESTPDMGGGHAVTDSNGDYALSLDPDVYARLEINGPLDGGKGNYSIETTGHFDLTINNIVQNLRLSLSSLTAQVRDSNGNPVSNGSVRGESARSTQISPILVGSTIPGKINSVILNSATASDGSVTFRVPTGVSFNAESISAQQADGTYIYNQNAVTVNNDTNVLLSLAPPTHTLSGTITDQNGNPLQNVSISIYPEGTPDFGGGNAHTDANGRYSIAVAPDVYSRLNVTSLIDGKAGFIIETSGYFDLRNGDATQDVRIPLMTLTVQVKNAVGNPASNSQVQGYAAQGAALAPVLVGSTSPANLNSGNYNATTDANGTVTFRVPQGTTINASSMWANLPDGTTIYNENPITVNTDTLATLSLAPPTHTLSGTITDQNGNPLQNVSISIYPEGTPDFGGGNAHTDANGRYSIAVTPGVYERLEIHGSLEGSKGYYYIETNGHFDLTSNDAIQNVRLSLSRLTILIRDAEGNPVANSQVAGNSLRSTPLSPILVGSTAPAKNNEVHITGTTDNNGSVTFSVPTGISFGANAISASLTNSTYIRNSAQIIISDNTTLLINAQPPVTVPTAPTNLSAASPTQYPSLFWLPVTGATSYNVYRNGYKIGSSTNPTYTDMDTPQGTYTYTVTAVNDGGESTPSNGVSVVIDRTPPEITYNITPAPINGWNNTEPITVTFICGDDRSGVESCTDPVTVPQGDGTYMFTGNVVDKAGNTNWVYAFVSVDTTKPTISNATFATNPKLPTDPTATLSAEVTDPFVNGSASGLSKVEYYDPVRHAWLPMTLSGSTATTTISTSDTEYPAGTYEFLVRATDVAGNVSTSATASLSVKNPNQAPVINTLTGGTVIEGSAYNENGTYSDPESTAWTATVDYGDGAGAQNLALSGTSFALGHIYQDEGMYTVTVSITDDEGATATTTATIAVTNAAASISPITTSGNLVLLGSTLTSSATFTDPGTADTHTAVWDWGDGSIPTTATLTESNGSGSVTGSHAYNVQGVYTVTLTITDNDGAVSTQTFQYIAVYNKGRFAGGDNFNSPIGASITAPWLSGVATFGISVDNNAQGQVSGTVKMDFDAGNIHLASSTPTVLVTTEDDHATLRGTGTVNGVSGYTYLITGFDGKVTKTADTIRFQIKNPSGQVIYDTQMNAADTDEPSTPLLNPGNGSKADNLVVTYFKN